MWRMPSIYARFFSRTATTEILKPSILKRFPFILPNTYNKADISQIQGQRERSLELFTSKLLYTSHMH